MSSGIAGIVRKTLITKLMTSSTMPPEYAAVMPAIAAMAVASAAAAAPRSNDRRAPTTTWEKMSLPWSVGPNRWCHDGAWRVARMLKSFGWSTEISGAINAITMTNASIARPVHDLGLRTSSSSQPGILNRPRRRGIAAGGSSAIGSSCVISSPSARPQPWVEDEVEHVHDQVREDHAHGQHDEERLGERIVVAEHRLLERVAGTGVAEDVLDEDESADGAREQRREPVERRQDRVAPGVARHHAAVGQALCVRHRHVVLADRVDHHRPHVEHPAARVGDEDHEDRQLRMAERAGEEPPAEPGREAGVVCVLDREPPGLQAEEVEPEQ